MSCYPTDSTYDNSPTCPNCGHEWEVDYETVSFEDGGVTELDCPDCDLKLECVTNVSYNFEIAHPSQCIVKGHHVPFINTKHNKHECLYCQQPLDCECTLHDHCKHNLNREEQ